MCISNRERTNCLLFVLGFLKYTKKNKTHLARPNQLAWSPYTKRQPGQRQPELASADYQALPGAGMDHKLSPWEPF